MKILLSLENMCDCPFAGYRSKVSVHFFGGGGGGNFCFVEIKIRRGLLSSCVV